MTELKLEVCLRLNKRGESVERTLQRRAEELNRERKDRLRRYSLILKGFMRLCDIDLSKHSHHSLLIHSTALSKPVSLQPPVSPITRTTDQHPPHCLTVVTSEGPIRTQIQGSSPRNPHANLGTNESLSFFSSPFLPFLG